MNPLPRATAIYALVHLGAALTAALLLLWPGTAIVGIIRFALIVFVLASLVVVAAFWHRRAWAARAEAVRLGLVTGGVIGLVLVGALRAEALAVAVAFSALSAGDLPDDDQTD